mmetsp:Transcript_38743/g.111341  ORF Transcript_38743/g.111341 Transcript_38743/m.111341 type:complete len:216 (+) Transcript_38743:140-787(+)
MPADQARATCPANSCPRPWAAAAPFPASSPRSKSAVGVVASLLLALREGDDGHWIGWQRGPAMPSASLLERLDRSTAVPPPAAFAAPSQCNSARAWQAFNRRQRLYITSDMAKERMPSRHRASWSRIRPTSTSKQRPSTASWMAMPKKRQSNESVKATTWGLMSLSRDRNKFSFVNEMAFNTSPSTFSARSRSKVANTDAAREISAVGSATVTLS